MMPPLVRLLGSPALLPGMSLLPLNPKDAALLARLALDGPVAAEVLKAWLWPDSSPTRRSSSLRQRLHRLEAGAGRRLVNRAAAGWTLCADVGTDLLAPPPDADAEALGAELLGSHGYADHESLQAWVNDARARWRDERRAHWARAADEAEARHALARALVLSRQLVDTDPTDEGGVLRLMRVHDRRGDRAAALSAYRDLCLALDADDLGPPRPALRALAARIEAQTGRLPSAAEPRPLALLRPPRFVGRDAAWAALQRAVDDRHGAIVTGDPGVGKSRLLQEFEAARGPAAACIVRALRGDRSIPYAMVGRLLKALDARLGSVASASDPAELARIVPSWGAATAGPLDSLELQASLHAALADWRGRGLAVLLLDDLHEADEASVDLLPEVLADPRLPTLVLAMRRHEVPRQLAPLEAAAGRGGPVRIALGPLPVDDVVDLLGSLGMPEVDPARWAPAIVRLIGGNPFHVLQLVADAVPVPAPAPGGFGPSAAAHPSPRLPAELPAGGPQALDRRIDRLGEDARQLARVAAVADRRFEPRLAAAVLGTSLIGLADAWRELEDAQLIADGMLGHDLIKDALLRTIAAPQRQALHARVAEVLQRAGVEPAVLAQHWDAAGRLDAAARCYEQAAEIAADACQKALEFRLAQRAAECHASLGAGDDAFRCRVRQLRAGRYAESYRKQLAHARDLVLAATTRAQRGRALELQARVLIEDFDHDTLIAAITEAGEIARETRDSTWALACAGLLAWSTARSGREAQARALVDKHLPMVLALVPSRAQAAMLADFGCALMAVTEVDAARRCFAQGLAIATPLQDWALCHDLHGHMAWVHSYLADLSLAIDSYEASNRCSKRMGVLRRPGFIQNSIQGRYYRDLGRYREALALLEDTRLHLNAEVGAGTAASVNATLSSVYLWLGQPARAQACLAAPAADAPAAAQRMHLLALARIEAAHGRPTLELLQAARRLAEAEGTSHARLLAGSELARALAPEAGAELALAMMREGDASRQVQMGWPGLVVACDRLRECGRLTEARQLADRIRQRLATAEPCVLYAPECWWIAAQACTAVGDDAASAELLGRARRWIVQTALPQVPEAFAQGFLHRNPVNRRLLSGSPGG